MNDDPDKVVDSKYYSTNEIQSFKAANKNKSLSVLYQCLFLNKNFYDSEYLLKCTNKKFDVAAVTETIITRNTSRLCNIRLKGYSVESTPTESSTGGTLLYIAITCLINLIMTYIFIKNLNQNQLLQK